MFPFVIFSSPKIEAMRFGVIVDAVTSRSPEIKDKIARLETIIQYLKNPMSDYMDMRKLIILNEVNPDVFGKLFDLLKEDADINLMSQVSWILSSYLDHVHRSKDTMRIYYDKNADSIRHLCKRTELAGNLNFIQEKLDRLPPAEKFLSFLFGSAVNIPLQRSLEEKIKYIAEHPDKPTVDILESCADLFNKAMLCTDSATLDNLAITLLEKIAEKPQYLKLFISSEKGRKSLLAAETIFIARHDIDVKNKTPYLEDTKRLAAFFAKVPSSITTADGKFHAIIYPRLATLVNKVHPTMRFKSYLDEARPPKGKTTTYSLD